MWGCGERTGAEARAMGAQGLCAACCLWGAQPPRILSPQMASAVRSMGIQISGLNGLPTIVCNECFVYIHKFYLFRERSKKSHSILVNYLKTLKANEPINFDFLKKEREKIYPTLTCSKTLIFDATLSDNSDQCNPNKIKFVIVNDALNYQNGTIKNECIEENMINVSDIKRTNSMSSSCSNKLDVNIGIDFLDELPFRIPVKTENDSLNGDEKRESNEFGERKRSFDSTYHESENDHFDNGDDDSSIDVPNKIKKKKCRETKHKKRKEKVKTIITDEISAQNVDDHGMDFLDELPRRVPVKEENDFKNTICNDEKKREAKEVGERKRSLDVACQESENDPFDNGDDDSSMDLLLPKITKKTKKRKNSSKKSRLIHREKRKGKVKLKTGEKSTENVNDKKLNNRMVLETEQYKVIKLNKEQILAEMATNAKSKRYLNSPHKCTLCVKGFNYEDVLQNHMTKHEPKNNYFECDLCHQFLPSAVSMRGHKKSHSTKYQCKICDVVKASRQHLLEHYMLVHDGAPRTYICNVCGKMLTKRTMFQKHMRIHYPSNKITCDKCGKLFKTIETLRAHMLHHEGGSLTRHTDLKPFSCDQCFKAFRYASLLYTHKVTHITTRNYYCVECDVRFKTQSNLRLHLRKSLKHVDPDLLKFGCDQCDRRYEDEKSLRRHVEWFHLRQKNYKCSKCDMQFGSPDGLRSHMKKIHDGIRPPPNHVCKICNRAFRAKAVLVKHIRVHTGERPYECPECGKKFAQNSTMSTHIKLVHLKMQRQVNRKKSIDVVQIEKKPLQEAAAPPDFTYSSPNENLDPGYFYGTGSAQPVQVMRPNPTAPFPKYQDDPQQAI